jgi:hypothetical protein
MNFWSSLSRLSYSATASSIGSTIRSPVAALAGRLMVVLSGECGSSERMRLQVRCVCSLQTCESERLFRDNGRRDMTRCIFSDHLPTRPNNVPAPMNAKDDYRLATRVHHDSWNGLMSTR